MGRGGATFGVMSNSVAGQTGPVRSVWVAGALALVLGPVGLLMVSPLGAVVTAALQVALGGLITVLALLEPGVSSVGGVLGVFGQYWWAFLLPHGLGVVWAVLTTDGRNLRSHGAEAAVLPEAIHDLGPTAVLGVLWTSAPAVLGTLLLVKLGMVSEWLKDVGPWGWAIYVVVFMVSAGIGFLPTYGQSFLGGWTFGFALGFPGAMLGFVGGSVVGYVIARSVAQDRVQDVLAKNPKAKAVRDALIGRGFWKTLGIVTLIRLPPNSPFALTNLVLTSAGVGLLPYVIGTAIGMAPRTAIAVYLAASFGEPGKSIADLMRNQPWWTVALGIGAAVLVLGVIGAIANKALAQVTSGGAGGGAGDVAVKPAAKEDEAR
jgi:uncharacterized membrane protein YdjX (TVP38/TMEM64 family)